MSLGKIVQEGMSNPFTRHVVDLGLTFIATHALVTMARASVRYKIAKPYRPHADPSKYFSHCIGKRIFRVSTFVYSAPITAVAYTFYNLIKNYS